MNETDLYIVMPCETSVVVEAEGKLYSVKPTEPGRVDSEAAKGAKFMLVPVECALCNFEWFALRLVGAKRHVQCPVCRRMTGRPARRGGGVGVRDG